MATRPQMPGPRRADDLNVLGWAIAACIAYAAAFAALCVFNAARATLSDGRLAAFAAASLLLVWDSRVGEGPWPMPDWAQPLVRTSPGIDEVRNVASPIRAPLGRSFLGRAPRLYWLSFAVVPPAGCLLPGGR